jgi:hypothetical protein
MNSVKMTNNYAEVVQIAQNVSVFFEDFIKIITQFESEKRFERKESFVIADVGVADGKNEIILIKNIVEKINSISENFPIEVYLNDLSQNMWDQVFENVRIHLAMYQNVYVYISPNSFYNNLFPEKKVDLFICNTMIYYLTALPGRSNAHLFCLKMNESFDEFSKWDEQAKSDLKHFYDIRASELKDRGYIVLTTSTYKDEMDENDCKFEKVNRETKILFEKNLEENGINENLSLAQVYRCPSHFIDYFNNSLQLRLNDIVIKYVELKDSKDYLDDKDVEKFSNSVVKYIRSYTGDIYKNMLECYTSDVDNIIENYYNVILKKYLIDNAENYPLGNNRLFITGRKISI